MITYISLLRGINVGGHHKIAMKDLQLLYQSLGFQNIHTYIQSGNVVFQSNNTNSAKIGTLIENALAKHFGFSISVIMRTKHEFAVLFQNNPFLAKKNTDIKQLYVVFFTASPQEFCSDIISDHKHAAEDFFLHDTHIYMRYGNGYNKTKLTNNFFEKKLGVTATTRNWKTVITLMNMTTAHTS